ncbi:protein ZNRD2 isoform X3 [Erinaceus europaeus]|uniref:Protein ZNRD2 isoform X3 n=1 Tax=Erinaceus europaeus TaxID=9365 RepID=A0ABM3W654_ERIEU|nr:protein ZNRD2 isoform X3 [Erinaceus europaeus]
MALNGVGEDLGCRRLELRGVGGSSLGQTPRTLRASLPPDVDDFSWEPPTEAETKVLQARRERQDRISRLMGDYLLRGYRMLSETCEDCGVRRDSRRGCGPGAARPPARTPLPRSPCRPRRPESRPALCSLAPRRSSCRTSSGKSTAWLVRSSTRTWTKIIRL